MVKRASMLILFAAPLMTALAGCNLNTATGGISGSISGAPVVQITAPQPNATYLQGVAVNIQASITNAGRDIDRVEIVIDGELVATLQQPNPEGEAAFTITHGWSASGSGARLIDVTAFRGDGSASAPANVAITITERLGAGGSPAPTSLVSPTATLSLLTTTQPTRVNPTAAPPTSTSAAPTGQTGGTGTAMATFNQGTNVRRGPGLEFEPPLGAYPAGQSVEILAVNPAGTWYKVRYGGGEGWVFAQLVTATGNIAALPRDPGPPPPTPRPVQAQPTFPPAPQPTIPPTSGANLVAGIVELNPAQPVCNQTFNVGLDVANLGTAPTANSGIVSLVDVRVADGSTQETTIGGFPVLQPGQTFRVDMPITVSTWYNEEHRLILIIDPDNQIPESDTNDNRREITYTLQRGGCP